MSSITHAQSDSPSVGLPPLLDIKDVRRIFGVSPDIAYQIMHSCGVIKLGRSLRVRPEDLESYIEQQRVSA
jgi:hypothetical protein